MVEEKAKLTTSLDRFEQRARIAWLLVIPILVAGAAALIQHSISKAGSRQEYVKLALSILKEPFPATSSSANSNADPAASPVPRPSEQQVLLRGWAVQLLDKYSPVRLDEETKQGLRSGAINLPAREDTTEHPPVEGDAFAEPRQPNVGDLVTFAAAGWGGNGLYTYEWFVDDKSVSLDRLFKTRFSTAGVKVARVCITSDNDVIFRDVYVEVRAPAP